MFYGRVRIVMWESATKRTTKWLMAELPLEVNLIKAFQDMHGFESCGCNIWNHFYI